MNVPFIFNNNNLKDEEFLEFCEKRGLTTLKGHRSVGGFRASIYNAMPLAGVEALIAAMQEYEHIHS
jgi:phosphoserine aminotransferase